MFLYLLTIWLKGQVQFFRHQPLLCDISLQESTYLTNDAYKRYLQHSWPQWWPVKVNLLTMFNRLPAAISDRLTVAHL